MANELFVKFDSKSNGIGKKLFSYGIKVAKEKYNAKYIELTTFKDNSFPRTWYESLGFSIPEDNVSLEADIDTVINNLDKNQTLI